MASHPAQPLASPAPPGGRRSLLAAGVAAVLASTCCLGPLVLLALGISGAWIGNLSALEAYRPFFIALALVALWLAWRPIWRPALACAPGQACAAPAAMRAYKLAFGLVAALVLLALGFPYLAPFFY